MRKWGMSEDQWKEMITISNERYEQNIVRYFRARQQDHPMYALGLAYYEMSDAEAEAAVDNLNLTDKMRAKMEFVALSQYRTHLENMVMA